MTLEYIDDQTATFTCTAFGGNNAQLLFRWISDIIFDTSSQQEMQNADNSTTSIVTTLPLSLASRGETYTCNVAYSHSPQSSSDATAALSIGEKILCLYNKAYPCMIMCPIYSTCTN